MPRRARLPRAGARRVSNVTATRAASKARRRLRASLGWGRQPSKQSAGWHRSRSARAGGAASAAKVGGPSGASRHVPPQAWLRRRHWPPHDSLGGQCPMRAGRCLLPGRRRIVAAAVRFGMRAVRGARAGAYVLVRLRQTHSNRVQGERQPLTHSRMRWCSPWLLGLTSSASACSWRSL